MSWIILENGKNAWIWKKNIFEPEKSLILINLWCFPVDLEKCHAVATASLIDMIKWKKKST